MRPTLLPFLPPQPLPERAPAASARIAAGTESPPAAPLHAVASLASMSSQGSADVRRRRGLPRLANLIWVPMCVTTFVVAAAPLASALVMAAHVTLGVGGLALVMAAAMVLLALARVAEERRAARELLGVPPG